MQKEFLLEYPNEPYKDNHDRKNTVKAVYTGARYLVIEVVSSEIRAIKSRNDDLDSIDLTEFTNDEEKTFVLIDADEFTWEAAYITNDYTCEDIPDYQEVNPDNSVYTFKYSPGNGILSQFYISNDLQYDVEEKKFYRPRTRVHMVTREDYFKSLLEHKKKVDTALYENRKMSSEDKQKLIEFRDWLDKAPVTYEKVDHWKIPWPEDLPEYF